MVRKKKAEVGFEPTNNGFAIRPLSPLGYSAAVQGILARGGFLTMDRLIGCNGGHEDAISGSRGRGDAAGWGGGAGLGSRGAGDPHPQAAADAADQWAVGVRGAAEFAIHLSHSRDGTEADGVCH